MNKKIMTYIVITFYIASILASLIYLNLSDTDMYFELSGLKEKSSLPM